MSTLAVLHRKFQSKLVGSMRTFEIFMRYYSQVVYADSEEQAREQWERFNPAARILYVVEVFHR